MRTDRERGAPLPDLAHQGALAALTMSVRFLLELGALGAIGVWGYTTTTGAASVALALALPAAAAAWWGWLIAPRAARRLRDPARFLAELVVWLGASLALAGLGVRAVAAGFGALAVATALGARRYEGAALRSPRDAPEVGPLDH